MDRRRELGGSFGVESIKYIYVLVVLVMQDTKQTLSCKITNRPDSVILAKWGLLTVDAGSIGQRKI